MNGTARLEIIYGIALSLPGKDAVEHQMEKDLSDEQTDLLSANTIDAVKPGLMSIGDANNASSVFGIPVASIDLHKNHHHFAFPKVPAATLKSAQKQYQRLHARQDPALLAAMRKITRAKPGLLVVLNIDD